MSEMFSTQEIIQQYENGLVGSWCDPEDTARFLSTLPQPLFGDTLSGDGKGKLVLNYKAVVAFEQSTGRVPYDETQTTGDCVSMAVRGASDTARANDPDILTTEDWIDRTATEPLYGARGHSGQGATCSRLVEWASRTGGLMLRKKYEGLKLDLTTYNASIGIRWGSTGVPEPVVSQAAHHRIGTVSLVTTWEQARDCIANGYGLVCCSNVGFQHTRDSRGMSFPKSTWNHAMQWTSVDDTNADGCRFCVQNSWGPFNSGPKAHDQPDGSFWIDRQTSQRMIAQGGTYAVSNVAGFPKRKLKDWGGREVLG